MSPLTTLAAIVFLSFLVEAAAGFGSMVVALTLGALWFSVGELLAWLVPVNMVLSAWLVFRDRRALRWRFFALRMLPLMGLGLALGTLVAARAAEATWLKPLFGLFVVAIAAWQLDRALRPAASVAPLAPAVRVAVLTTAGLIHGIFTTGGPLAVFVAARELQEKAAFRGTLSLLWLTLNALVVPRLALEGSLDRATLRTSALMLAPLAVGIAAGELVHHKLDERRFRIVVAVLLLIAGAVLLAKAALQ
ncbi:MAG: TSUP family transporter [Myxococcota bacterium]